MRVTETLLSEERAVLSLAGRLDATSAPAFKARLQQLIQDGHIQLIINLGGISFIDSSGLAALVSALKRTREVRGALKLVGLNEQARTVFRTTLLDRVFEFQPDVASALDTLPDPGEAGPARGSA